jgi:glycosyltransferase involved in cell wall biosynthesis
LNLLFASWYTGLGGGETDLLTLARDLDPARYTPHLLLPRAGRLGELWQAQGGQLHILPYRGATTWFHPAVWAAFPVVGRMADFLREQQITLIHSDYHTLPLIYPAAQQAKIPILWTCHGWWFKPKLWQRAFFRQIPGAARSYNIRGGFLGKPPFMPAENLPVIYSGIDTERFHPDVDGIRVRFEANIPQDAPVVAMVARFQPVKGQHTFQAMARQVALQIPDAHFIVAGEDSFGVAADEAYRERILQNATNDPLLRKRLHYIGFREDVERVYGAADVVVCASDFESYGKANLEAMACGKPVVSTNRGGPGETVLDGDTGYLVAPGDVPNMALLVIQLLRDANERARLGKNGRARIEEIFAMKTTTAQYEALFERVLIQQTML